MNPTQKAQAIRQASADCEKAAQALKVAKGRRDGTAGQKQRNFIKATAAQLRAELAITAGPRI